MLPAPIHYTTTRCGGLGTVLVATRNHRLSAVCLSADAAAGVKWLKSVFPSASLVPDTDKATKVTERDVPSKAKPRADSKPTPKADTNPSADSARITQTIIDYLTHTTTTLPPLALEQDGTPFQQLVWKTIAAIPRGETRSYTDIANELGRPKAVRAVARAIASNRIAVVVPCHRVVGSKGQLTGYRWGVDRKRALLELEGGLEGLEV